MRSVAVVGGGGTRPTGRVLRLLAAAVLIGMMAAGCGGHQASGQERLDNPGPPDTTRITEERLLPGDQRTPDEPSPATTAPRREPIGRALIPAVTTTSTATTTLTSPGP